MTTAKEIIALLSQESKSVLLKSLLKGELLEILDPREEIELMGHQKVPADLKGIFLLEGGRGAGKTFAQAVWALQKALDKPDQRIALLVPSHRCGRYFTDIVCNIAPRGSDPKIRYTQNEVVFTNGSIIKIHTGIADFRGSRFDHVVIGQAEKTLREGLVHTVQEIIALNTVKGAQIYIEGDLPSGSPLIDQLKNMAVAENSIPVKIRHIESHWNRNLSKDYLERLKTL